jgi:hypothetical protein
MEVLIDFFSGTGIWTIAKILVIIGLVIYLIFALVVVKQVKMMTKVISGDLDLLIKLISWVHFLVTIFTIFLAIIIL